MTNYVEILYSTLALNLVALMYRNRQWICRLLFGVSDRTTTTTTTSNSTTDSNTNDDHNNDTTIMAQQQIRHHLLYRTYLPVYLLAACADWLQGPYKYAVYSAYGYSQYDISILFVAGFGSGMTLGSIVGGMADSFGRKRMALVYCLSYTLSCLAKHMRPFGMLLLGRILGGIATSLLFSVFDAWLIRAAALQKIDKAFLSECFAAANFGSSIVAILAGLVANNFVEGANPLRPVFWRAAQAWMIQEAEGEDQEELGPPALVDDERWNVAWVYRGGGIVAFDLALIPLALCFLLALAFWDENYGEDLDHHGVVGHEKGKKQRGMFASLHSASVTIWRSPAIFNLCAVTSFFEGAMYVFILLWTPALRLLDTHPEKEDYAGPPLGIVFATFMVCCMLGTSIFSILSSIGVRPSQLLVYTLALSTVSCFVIATASDDTTSFMAMLLFEACIGAYYPAMSTCKGNIVPEDQRAAIYSVFRLPLNFVVLLNLISHLGFRASFGICTVMLVVATILQCRIVRWEHTTGWMVSQDHTSKSNEMRPILKAKQSDIDRGDEFTTSTSAS